MVEYHLGQMAGLFRRGARNMNVFKRTTPPLPSDLDDPSPEEQAAAVEAQRVIERVSGRLPPDPSLQPMPLFSWQSVREVFTMSGRFTLIRYDDSGNPNVGAAFWANVTARVSAAAISRDSERRVLSLSVFFTVPT